MINGCTFVCKNKKNAAFYQKICLIVCCIINISYFCRRIDYLIIKNRNSMNNAQLTIWWWRNSRSTKS